MSALKAGFLFLVFGVSSSLVLAAGDLDDMTMEIILPEQPAGNLLQLPDVHELQVIDEHMLQEPHESHDLGFEELGEGALGGDAFSNSDRGDIGESGSEIDTIEPGLRFEPPIDNMDTLMDFFDGLPPIIEPDKSEVLLGGV